MDTPLVIAPNTTVLSLVIASVTPTPSSPRLTCTQLYIHQLCEWHDGRHNSTVISSIRLGQRNPDTVQWWAVWGAVWQEPGGYWGLCYWYMPCSLYIMLTVWDTFVRAEPTCVLDRVHPTDTLTQWSRGCYTSGPLSALHCVSVTEHVQIYISDV